MQQSTRKHNTVWTCSTSGGYDLATPHRTAASQSVIIASSLRVYYYDVRPAGGTSALETEDYTTSFPQL